MAMQTQRRRRGTPLRELNLKVDKFNLGYMSILDEARLPIGAAAKALNQYQVQDGLWTPRYGSRYYNAEAAANIDGGVEFVKANGTTELIEVIGGTVYKSTNGGTRTAILGATLTGGIDPFFIQIRSYLYIFNGTDVITRYDGSVLTQYTALTTPAAPTLAKTGLAGTTYTYYYQIVAYNDIGNSIASAEASITVGKQREDWGAADFVGLSWAAVAGASRYGIFASDQTGRELYLTAVNGLSYNDDNSIAINPFVETPNDNTSQGPKFRFPWLSGNRMWGTWDPNNPWRVYFGGTGQNQGTFSPFYGGGWIDLEKGGRERPFGGAHYRDGKGSAFSTIFTSDPQGRGSTWQVGLDTATIGTTSFIVPSATKVVGSIGSGSPRGIVQVNDDIMFPNIKGAYSLGSKPQLLNVLSTREVSANIRPDWRNLTTTGMQKTSAYFYDAKVFWCVPYGTSNNSEVWVMDTEKRNWQLRWVFPFGIKYMFEYTDTNGISHLLAVPVSGKQLIEIGSSIQGDLGQPFGTEYKTGRIWVSQDHTEWAQVLFLYIEIGRLAGDIVLEILGEDKKKGFISLGSMQIIGTSESNAGWGTRMWSSGLWSDTSATPSPNSPLIATKKLRVNKLIRNLQIRVLSTSLTASFTILDFQAKGFMVPTNDPSDWRKAQAIDLSSTATAITTEDGTILVVE
jgi:hypothetical protein